MFWERGLHGSLVSGASLVDHACNTVRKVKMAGSVMVTWVVTDMLSVLYVRVWMSRAEKWKPKRREQNYILRLNVGGILMQDQASDRPMSLISPRVFTRLPLPLINNAPAYNHKSTSTLLVQSLPQCHTGFQKHSQVWPQTSSSMSSLHRLSIWNGDGRGGATLSISSGHFRCEHAVQAGSNTRAWPPRGADSEASVVC